jgi:hypothetical protein
MRTFGIRFAFNRAILFAETRFVVIARWNCSGDRLMLARPDLTTLFEDLRHLVDALGSSDLTLAESKVLCPQVCRVIETIQRAGAMGQGFDPESCAREGRLS